MKCFQFKNYIINLEKVLYLKLDMGNNSVVFVFSNKEIIHFDYLKSDEFIYLQRIIKDEIL